MDQEKAQNPNRIKKILRITGIIAGVIVAFFLAAFAGLLIYVDANDDQIKEVIINQLNSHLDADITINAADIEVAKHFPDLSVRLSGTTISPSGYAPGLPAFARAGTFYIRIDLWSVIRKEYIIKSFVLEDTDVVVYRSESGKTNYGFLIPEDSSGNAEAALPQISVPSLQLKNVGFQYIDNRDALEFSGHIRASNLSLKVRDSVISINLEITAKADVPGISLPGEYTSLLLEAGYYPADSMIAISGGRIAIDDMILYLSSETISLSAGKGYNLNVEARDLDFRKAIALVPGQSEKIALEYNPYGKISFTGIIKGADLYSGIPEVALTAELKIDTLYPMGRDLLLHDMTATLETGYFPDNPAGFYLKLTNLKTQAQKNTSLEGWIVVRNLEQQFINSSLQGTLDFSDFAFLLPENSIAEGVTTMELKYKGKISGFREDVIKELESSESNLKVDFRNGRIEIPGKEAPLFIPAIKADINPEKAIITALSLKTGNSDIQLSGHIDRVLNMLNKKNASGDLVIRSSALDLDQIMSLWSNKDHDAADKAGLMLPALNTNLDLTVDKLIYSQNTLTDIVVEAHSTDEELCIENLRLWGCEGQLTAQGSLYDYTTKAPRMNATINGKGVAISEVFKMFHDFGSESLTHNNISGSLTTEIFLSTTFTEDFHPVMETFTGDANLLISDGALSDFGPLTEFSGFLGLDDLSDIRFETLENQIFIKENTLYIPGMEIKNNVLDLYMEGRQSFEGEMEYHIDLALAELLSGKYHERNRDGEFGVVQDDNRKGTRLFVKVSGTTEEPKFKYDTPRARKRIGEELRAEKEELRKLLPADGDSAKVPESRENFEILWEDTNKITKDSIPAPKKKKKEKKFEIDW